MRKNIRWLLAVFATYRVASMISHDEGPHVGWPHSPNQQGFFEAIRTRLGVYDYGPDGLPETNLARGLSCPLCVGVYVAALVMLAVVWPSKVGDWFLGWLGIAGAQTFLENLTSDDAIQGAIEDVADNI